MKKSLLLLILPILSIGQVKPFPDCFGAGCETSNDGWRGGTIVKVTSLGDNPSNVVEGTWRWAITRTFPRIIIFDVSGVINLQESIRLNDSNGNVYVAGQTSPNGIIIRGYTHEFTSIDEVVIRHVKFYGDASKTPANDNNAGQLGGTLAGFIGGTKIVIDHCDFLYNQNESQNFYADDGNFLGEVTQSYNIFGDADGLGSLIGGDPGNTVGEASSFRNLFIHLSHRTPNAQQGVTAEYINNVTYNTRNRLTNVHSGSQVNFYSNYHKAGPFTAFTPSSNFDRLRRRNLVDWQNGQQVWLDPVHWNFMTGVVESNLDTHTDVFIASARTTQGSNIAENPQPALSTWLRTSAVTMTKGPRPNILTNLQAVTEVLDKAGARYYLTANGNVTEVEDSKQTELINDFNNGTYTNENNGNYTLNETVPSIANTTRGASYDTDNDGMPDVWETTNGLNPSLDDSALDADSDGYTNVEEFLNLIDVDVVVNIPQITRTDSFSDIIVLGSVYNPPTGTWTDVEDGSGAATVGGDVVDVNTVGNYNVTLFHTDTDGNTGTLNIVKQVVSLPTPVSNKILKSKIIKIIE